ncbi:hypothetical protein KKA14_07635 [bacterium]|nr:hypothetical protein [bacterium]
METKELMSPEEENRLKELEAIIKEDLKGFIRVGMALKEIKKTRLYRGKYNDWKDYLKTEWDLGRRIADYQIEAYSVVKNIEEKWHNCATFKNQTNDNQEIILPINEAQTRPLTLLPPAQQITAWEQVIKRTEGKVTALEVSKVVEEFLAKKHTKESELIKKQVNMSAGISDDFSEAFSIIIDVIDKHRAAGWKNLKRKKAIALVAAIMDHLK